MKYSSDKKLVPMPEEPRINFNKLSIKDEKVDTEASALRRELEGCRLVLSKTKEALRLQTVRFRQLVAAFSTKLQEKETELRAARELKELQLSRVLRTLLVFESELRREQKKLQHQLGDKDKTIHRQQLEIARLKKTNQRLRRRAMEKHTSEANARVSTQSLPAVLSVESQPAVEVQNGDESTPDAECVSACKKNCAPIRISSSVSSLITGSAGSIIISELNHEPAETEEPEYENVRANGMGAETKFEHESSEPLYQEVDSLQCNFEEFRLEEVESSSDPSDSPGGSCNRHAGDGAESQVASAEAGSDPRRQVNLHGSYEKFLEATGLSQKSILTPTRIFSNHRSMLKPKDIKHRSKVKAAFSSVAIIEKSGNTVKYWTEPFL